MKRLRDVWFDDRNECLWRGGTRIHLTVKAFAILRQLVEQQGRLVTKDHLMRAVWPDTFVQEENLKVHVQEIRRALGDSSRDPSFIETHQGRGYRLVAPVYESVDEASADAPAGALFGREAAMQFLRDRFHRALNGRRQIVFITGDPGIGKTSLISAFLERVAAPANATVASGCCIPALSRREAYYPVLDALGRLCRVDAAGSPIQVLARFAPTWLLQFPDLVEAADGPSIPEPAGESGGRMLREIVDALEALSRVHPLVLVLEDLHAADEATLDVIAALAHRSTAARLLLLASYRPVDAILARHPVRSVEQELRVRGLCRELALEALAFSATLDFIDARFGDALSVHAFAERMHEQTGGNPLFLITAIDSMIAGGVIVRSSGGWDLDGAVSRLPSLVPDSLREIIEMQIRRLDDADQELLSIACVAGLRFNAALIAEELETDAETAEQRCERLAERNMILRRDGCDELPDGTVTIAYTFQHSLYYEVLHRRQAPLRRARLHQRMGQRIESLYASRLHERAAALARHFGESGDGRRAVRYLQLAADRAARRRAYADASHLLHCALTAADRLPEVEREGPRASITEQLHLLEELGRASA